MVLLWSSGVNFVLRLRDGFFPKSLAVTVPIMSPSRVLQPRPGIGLGLNVSRSVQVTDEMMIIAARVLADLTTDSDLAKGSMLYTDQYMGPYLNLIPSL